MLRIRQRDRPGADGPRSAPGVAPQIRQLPHNGVIAGPVRPPGRVTPMRQFRTETSAPYQAGRERRRVLP
jgi:hypothetical protein